MHDDEFFCQESHYDDVGPPTARLEVEASSDKDGEGIYDDVMPPLDQVEASSCKEPLLELRATPKDRAAEMPTTNDDRYFSTTNNEYSSVLDCESHLGEEEREDELGVYDDVGLLPGEERVNSLYAGSAPGSVLGLTSMNGKESEWEDLEESSCASRCPCQTNDPW